MGGMVQKEEAAAISTRQGPKSCGGLPLCESAPGLLPSHGKI